MYENYRWTRISQNRNNLTQAYEPLQVNFLNTIAKREGRCVFFDIGSNVGAYSIILSGNANVTKIIAVEALPECAKEIRGNIKLNDLHGRIKVVESALSDTCREVSFLRTKPYGGDSGILDTYLFDRLVNDQILKMQAVTLDGLVDTIELEEKTVIMKIDVEGHELSVLRGAKNVLSNSTGWIQCEIHKKSPNHDKVFEYLDVLGWKKVFRLGWDYYFTNHRNYFAPNAGLEAVETLLDAYIEDSRSPVKPKPARSAILPGVTIEVSRNMINTVKRFFSLLK